MPDLPIVVVWGLKATPILVVGWLATMALARSSAARRHFVWTLAIVGTLVLPAVAAMSPRLAVPVLPAAPADARAGAPVAATAAEFTRAEAAEPNQSVAPIGDESTGRQTPGGLGAIGGPLWILWAAGAIVIGWSVAASLTATTWLARRARRVDDATLLSELDDAQRALGVPGRVRLLIATGSAMPMTWGLLHPVVLLPDGVQSWTSARRRAVLLHELAHVRRRDWLTQLAARLACALYWWHPLAWVAAGKLREERELACDDMVLSHGAPAPDYASQLLEIARWLRAPRATTLAGVAMARPAELAGRLLAVLDGARLRAPVPRRAAMGGAFLAAALVVSAGGVRLARAAPPVQPARSSTSLVDVVPWPAASPAASPARQREPSLAPAPHDEYPAVVASAWGGLDQGAGALCDWSVRGSSRSSHTNLDDHDATIRIVVDGCELFVRAHGRVTFTDDDRTVRRIESGGYFEIEERRDRDRRRAEFASRGGNLDRRWFVDGSEQAWSGEADEWLHGALLAMFRRTSFEARARAERIHGRAGKEGLLGEIAHLHSSSALGAYFTVLFERERVTPQEARQLATLAGERIRSSSELSKVLVAIVTNSGVDEATRVAVVRSAEHISSSSERARVLTAAVEVAPLSPALADAVLETAAGISSSSEKARVLVAVNARVPPGRSLPDRYVSTASGISSSSELGRVLVDLLRRDAVSSEQVATALEVARQISSSSERGRVLRVAVEQHALDARTRAPFFSALSGISSSSEREDVLRAVTSSNPDQASVALIIESAKAISSSSSRASVLVGVAGAGLLTSESLRSAYRDAAQGISSRSERERALRALGEV